MVAQDVTPENHETVDRSGSGAPAGGHAVRDFFSTDEIFLRVAASADEEFARSNRLLFFSGLAAGLSIGLSFMARATISAQIVGDSADLIANLFYPIGFLLIVMGRYQLFTENTLTPVTLVLTRVASLPSLLRNWSIVLSANLLGALLVGFALATTNIFDPDAEAMAVSLGEHAIATPWLDLVFKGVVAGWLVASMVWLIHAARDSITRVFMIFFIMYLIPSMGLYHCIIGACEAFYVVFHGEADIFSAFFGFVVPVIIGNTIGGVLLVAILNYAQTSNQRFPHRDCGQLELTLREWFFQFHDGSLDHNGIDREHPTKLAEAMQEHDHVCGNPDSQIQLVHYGDYQCQTSRDIYEIAIQLVDEHGISYVFRHLPLSRRYHQAMQAARAAEAAARQGKFREMHDELFRNQTHLENRHLLAYAEGIGLDTEQFAADMQSQQIEDRIKYDRKTAVKSNVRTTDNLFINGERYRGEWRVEAILDYIDHLEAVAA